MHKHDKRLDISQKNLERFETEEDSFLNRLVTTDETWAHYYEPENKWQSLVWKHPTSPSAKNSSTVSAICRKGNDSSLLEYGRSNFGSFYTKRRNSQQ